MKPETIAIFDFDGTLVKGDSLWPFLVAVAGRFRCLASLFEALVLYPFCRSDEARTFIKARLLRRILGGRHVADLGPAIRKLRAWPVWNKTTLTALRDHHAKGHRVVIASGSLDVYLSALLEKVPHDALICTRLQAKDDVLTGLMESGNCVRQRKAELVAAYLAAHGPFAESWGYGNLPHDLPMLALVQHKIIV